MVYGDSGSLGGLTWRLLRFVSGSTGRAVAVRLVQLGLDFFDLTRHPDFGEEYERLLKLFSFGFAVALFPRQQPPVRIANCQAASVAEFHTDGFLFLEQLHCLI